MLDILKIIFCTPFLLYSCYSDIKTRRVSDYVWLAMLAGGAFFILYELSKLGSLHLLRLFISAGLMFVFLYLYSHISTFFHIREMGGADQKLLLVLSIIFPVYPMFQVVNLVFPLNMPMNFFALSVLGDALVAAIILPVGFAVYNLTKMGMHIDKPLYIFLGYKTRISELAGKRVWICQDFDEKNGKIKTLYLRSGIENNEKTLAKFEKLLEKGLIKDEVWVTPKVPFMIPLTIGFLVAVFFGDFIFEIVKYAILR